ncbi:hypothetical protein E2C01_063838 [Portunus trituberculatus]|uniref:Uncharacterized protein n=1 Tax=Portunus trituberculatus TaxID=210409 RepID=A0A5B7HLM5_PORTR|nr:hypothetical protein [Portunus trituberculatus]
MYERYGLQYWETQHKERSLPVRSKMTYHGPPSSAKVFPALLHPSDPRHSPLSTFTSLTASSQLFKTCQTLSTLSHPLQPHYSSLKPVKLLDVHSHIPYSLITAL